MPDEYKMSDDDKKNMKKQEKRYKLQDLLRMKNNVEEMILLDSDEIKGNEEAIAILKQTHALLGDLMEGGGEEELLSKEDALKEVSKLRKKMNGEKDEEEEEEEEEDE